jgi:signal transduction histidine kinase
MPLPYVARSTDDRVLGGVCAGIAEAISVDPTLVRLVFALLALAGGAGVVLYAALWFWSDRERRRKPVVPVLLGVVAACLALSAFGLSGRTVAAIAAIAGGLTLIWRSGGSLRPGEPLPLVGVVLVAAGAALLLSGGGPSVSFLAPGAILGALLLIVGPWLWSLAVDRDAERTARIRTEERAEVAARVHDSVLQTLALIQKHSDEPRTIASLARRQERELRDWLYGDGAGADAATLVGALNAAAAEVEEVHGVRIDVASSGDSPLDDSMRAIVLAAREAMANAAKFSGREEIAVYAEVDDEVNVYVRDRGVGFDREAVAGDRRGIAESIEGRMRRAGGAATVTSAPGEGTEVELSLPRTAA